MKLHKIWKILFVLVVLTVVVIFGVFMTITVPAVTTDKEVQQHKHNK